LTAFNWIFLICNLIFAVILWRLYFKKRNTSLLFGSLLANLNRMDEEAFASTSDELSGFSWYHQQTGIRFEVRHVDSESFIHHLFLSRGDESYEVPLVENESCFSQSVVLAEECGMAFARIEKVCGEEGLDFSRIISLKLPANETGLDKVEIETVLEPSENFHISEIEAASPDGKRLLLRKMEKHYAEELSSVVMKVGRTCRYDLETRAFSEIEP
jgi:hypothetical protein